jgi:hypothetical protein
MGIYNQYPLGINGGFTAYGPNSSIALAPSSPQHLDGMGDWFLSPPPYGNVAHARTFAPHIGEMDAYFGPDSQQINMSTMEGLGTPPSFMTNVFQKATEKAVSAGTHPEEHHETHELVIPDWLKFAGGGLALFLILRSLSKKKVKTYRGRAKMKRNPDLSKIPLTFHAVKGRSDILMVRAARPNVSKTVVLGYCWRESKPYIKRGEWQYIFKTIPVDLE